MSVVRPQARSLRTGPEPGSGATPSGFERGLRPASGGRGDGFRCKAFATPATWPGPWVGRRLRNREQGRAGMAARGHGGSQPAVIVRVLTAQVPPGRVGQFNVSMRRQLAILRDQPGLVYVKLARRLESGGGEEVVLFEEWRDPDSVYAWAGDDLSRPRLLPAAFDAASEIMVTHYEALDIGLEDDPADASRATGAAEGSPGAGSRRPGA
ncbi:MAG TPA: antibiotic biosynthesis monooxygenase [Candidatus Limnocylindrales bacterium]|nr:antibiotic biosynthesis monooxygenase [Candidatus Limnocylindrales bacterium]